jgi:hypothetical protein
VLAAAPKELQQKFSTSSIQNIIQRLNGMQDAAATTAL